MEDEDKEALAGLSPVPPPRKVHSYSQQLRGTTGSKCPHPVRKHSLDDIPRPTNTCTTTATTTVADHFYDSSDDDLFSNNSNVITTSGVPVNEDYVCPGPDAADDQQQHKPFQPMVEFIGSGGGTGIFKVPSRAAVHPGRPPCLELRPHPLKETQAGRFLRNIACTDTQLWAGQECGVKFWNLEDSYEPGAGIGGRARRGDEDAAPFYESANTSPTMCLMVDCGNRLVWTGHKDGKIRSWKMDQTLDDANNPFKEGLSWQAHRGPVLAMIFSSQGKLLNLNENFEEYDFKMLRF